MNKSARSKAPMCAVALFLPFFMFACTDGDGRPPTKIPSITATIPANDAIDVPINRNISASFSHAMDPLSINEQTFLVTGPDATPVAGIVSYDEATAKAKFDPSDNLSVNTTFTATVTVGASALTGMAMAADSVWSFTTGETTAADDDGDNDGDDDIGIDPVIPTVSSTTPVDTATEVPINRNVTVTFNQSMAPTTITSATFSVVGPGMVAVPGTVTYVGTTATFDPTDNLEADTAFTATIAAGATDISGNKLASAHAWTFTTGSTAAEGPAPVILGTAGNFVILAKSAISTTGVTAIVGDIGLSPAAQSFITGFSETLDATNQFATASIVTGKLYAADMAVPTPSNMTTAVSNMETAYTDAAGRVTPDFTEHGAGDVTGMTLAPGLYKWGTGVLMTSDVTISGGPNDVWIFQVAQDVTVSNGVKVTLIGGALPKNIFWQVAGKVVLGTTSAFKGVILSQTKIVMETGASLNGRALAQTAVTLDANAVSQPAP